MKLFEAYSNVYHLNPDERPKSRPARDDVRRQLASRRPRPSACNGTWGDPL